MERNIIDHNQVFVWLLEKLKMEANFLIIMYPKILHVRVAYEHAQRGVITTTTNYHHRLVIIKTYVNILYSCLRHQPFAYCQNSNKNNNRTQENASAFMTIRKQDGFTRKNYLAVLMVALWVESLSTLKLINRKDIMSHAFSLLRYKPLNICSLCIKNYQKIKEWKMQQ